MNTQLDLMTITDIAKYVGVSRATLYLWMEAGLPYYAINNSRRIRKSELDNWINAQRVQKPVKAEGLMVIT